MNLLRRLFRLTASYWMRRHGVDRSKAVELADLAMWDFHATDEQIIERRAYDVEDAADPEPW